MKPFYFTKFMHKIASKIAYFLKKYIIITQFNLAKSANVVQNLKLSVSY